MDKTIREEFKETSYILILKLLIGNEEVKSLNIKIPETTAFYNGIAMNQFYNLNNEIKVNSPKEGFSTLEIRKFFMEIDFKIMNSMENNEVNEGSLRVKSGVSGSIKESFTKNKMRSRSSIPSKKMNNLSIAGDIISVKTKNEDKNLKEEEKESKIDTSGNKFSRPFTFVTLSECNFYN